MPNFAVDAASASGKRRLASDLASAAVLVVDDEPGMRNFLAKALGGPCARVDVTSDTAEASDLLDNHRYDVIVLDNVMPKKSGIQWLGEQQRIGLFSDVILMTAYADLDTAIAAIRAGASDFLLKPFRSNQILNAISQSMVRSRLRRQNSVLSHELAAGADVLRHRSAILGSSPEIQRVRTTIERAATTDAHVVVRGEVGSGKQIAARMLHAHSGRAGKPFLWLQCYGMSEEAFQSQLFGRISEHGEEGHNRDGILMNAAGGMLFLDDVEMLSMRCQNVLLELLTTGRFRPMGAARSVSLDVRIVSSTTQPLAQSVQDRTFRVDLFYLLNVVEISLPPLRERAQDILELTQFFVKHMAARMRVAAPELSPAARRKILAYHWPGNVMELRNYVERALIHGDFETGIGVLSEGESTESLSAVEQRHILSVLDACGGNRAEAARRLGVARKTIDRKCQAWGL